MRRILVSTLLAAGLLATGSVAQAGFQARTPGAQQVELKSGQGRAVVSKQGAIVITVRVGRVRVVDLPGGKPPFRNCNRSGIRVRPGTVEYRGREIRCRVWSGNAWRPWQVVMRGRGIFASGVARGSLTLDGVNTGRTGVYRVGARPFKAWPRTARTFALRR